MQQRLSDTQALKGLLHPSLLEGLAPCLVPRACGVGGPGKAYVAAAREVLDDLLAHGTERLTSFTATAGGVAEVDDLQWHHQAHDVGDP